MLGIDRVSGPIASYVVTWYYANALMKCWSMSMYGVQQCTPCIYIDLTVTYPTYTTKYSVPRVYIARFKYLALEYNIYTQVTFKYTINTTMKNYYVPQSIRIHIQVLLRPQNTRMDHPPPK